MQLAIVINLLFLAQYVLFRVIKFNMENKMKIKRILISALVILGFTSLSNVANPFMYNRKLLLKWFSKLAD